MSSLDPVNTPAPVAPDAAASPTARRYWRSLDELQKTPEFQKMAEKEFPEYVKGEKVGILNNLDDVSRRRFLQLMGASASLAVASGCVYWDKDNLADLTKRPEGWIPGTPKHFSSAYEICGVATPVRVTSYDGRPIKIEGNASHPMSQGLIDKGHGGTDVFGQASILEMYDPDRSKSVYEIRGGSEKEKNWKEFAEALEHEVATVKGNKGAGLYILTEATSSPTIAALKAKLLATFPRMSWTEYEPVSDDNVRAGSKLAFGKVYRTQLKLKEAMVVVSFDGDLFMRHPASVSNSRDFASNRDPEAGVMNRLYAIESRFSTTGVMAEHRLPLRSEQILPFLAALHNELAAKLPALQAIKGATNGGFLEDDKVQKYLKAITEDLLANQGKSVVDVGPGQPPAAHAIAHHINAALGNAGKTVSYTLEADQNRPAHTDAIKAFAADLSSGKVELLLILGGNPAYNTPGDLKIAKSLGQPNFSAHLSSYVDETSRLCKWHLPKAHYLESWSDALSYDGSLTLTQPIIEPLYKGKTPAELLVMLLGEEAMVEEKTGPKGETEKRYKTSYELTYATFKGLVGTDTDVAFRKTLHDGFAANTAPKAETPAVQALPALSIGDIEKKPLTNGQLELTFVSDSKLFDGRYANSGWLQELPDFMTKLVWDNAALIGPKTAQDLGIAQGDLVRIKANGAEIEIAAYIMPGQAAGSISLALGYGRTNAGHVGGLLGNYGLEKPNDTIPGFNVYPLISSDNLYTAKGATITATGSKHKLVSTQGHHLIDAVGATGRDERMPEIVRETTLEEFKKDEKSFQPHMHYPKQETSWHEGPGYLDSVPLQGHRWGMAIDLNKCDGCNACVVACQAENNIPIVGKEQVSRGRAMHWIRIDMYFQGDNVESPEAVYQPITCQQCELAPCEQVCPVAATVHTKEGLNDMVYNRCIGTRYCSNNCPYKVRRFNFFNYYKDMEKQENEVRKMLFNPEVTVRSRGVMEKCTFCVQRISAVRIRANNENKRPIQDLEIRTACQEACSAEAIVFGDLSDKDSMVSKKHASSRSYKLLDEMLNTQPRNVFLARVRNPHPALYEPKGNYVKAKAHAGGHEHAHEEGHGEAGHAGNEGKPEAAGHAEPKGEVKTEEKAH